MTGMDEIAVKAKAKRKPARKKNDRGKKKAKEET